MTSRDRTRVVIAGLPRSGTTWIGEAIAAAPGVTYVHEPDNINLEPYAGLALNGFGGALAETATAGGEYRMLWELAFRGGWAGLGPLERPVAVARRFGRNDKLPLALRIAALKGAARMARSRAAPSSVIVVKTVAAHLALEWLDATFQPRVVVVWRHPLNVVAAWFERGWRGAELASRSASVQARFAGTPVWPPPSGTDAAATTWGLCAQHVLTFEVAARHPAWVVLHHERTTLDPSATLHDLVTDLGLQWDDAIMRAIEARVGTGTAYETVRVPEREPRRWEERLDAGEVAAASAVIERFAETSPIAAASWAASPAVAT